MKDQALYSHRARARSLSLSLSGGKNIRSIHTVASRVRGGRTYTLQRGTPLREPPTAAAAATQRAVKRARYP